MEQKLTLSELQNKIKEAVECAMPVRVWVMAEIAEIKEQINGHCYLDLIDYMPESDTVSAKVRAVIWNSSYKILKPFFETSTGSPLSEGMHVLLKVQVQYSVLYGLSLVINDIDPSFTVGEMELRKQRTIARLKSEGMLDMNSGIVLPVLPRNLAIISSLTAAGYADFMKHLNENEYGFHFNTRLFQAPMQGTAASAGIIAAFDSIAEQLRENNECFDAVILIRGGGANSDLTCFDDYDLAANIAQFPIPVITGIGHEIDFHICDMVAHTWLKTPTAVADFILDIFIQEDTYIASMMNRVQLAVSMKIKEQESMLERAYDKIRNICSERIVLERNKLDSYELRLNAAIPEEVLSKGFGIVYLNEKRIASVENIADGDKIVLILKDGRVSFDISNVIIYKNLDL